MQRTVSTALAVAAGTVILGGAGVAFAAVDGPSAFVPRTATAASTSIMGPIDRASRYGRTPSDPTATVAPPLPAAKQVIISADGTTTSVETTAKTVAAVLAGANIALTAVDEVVPGQAAGVYDGLVITIHRTTYGEVTATEPIPFTVDQQPDASLAKGSTVIATPGATGSQDVVYSVTYVDGVVSAQTVISRAAVIGPRTQVELVGTFVASPSTSAATVGRTTTAKTSAAAKPAAPAPVVVKTTTPATPVQSTTAPAAPAPPASTTGLNWDAVAQCESSGNWSINTGNGYYGGLQFGLPTWLSNGGGVYAARPDLATKAQQIAIANKLYAARGAAPWPTCGRLL